MLDDFIILNEKLFLYKIHLAQYLFRQSFIPPTEQPVYVPYHMIFCINVLICERTTSNLMVWNSLQKQGKQRFIL